MELFAHLSTECSLSYCDHSPSVVVHPFDVRPSVHNLLVNALASTNINQSSPNLVKMYIYDCKISDKYDYGSNGTRTIRVIGP